jgi:predicted acyltransferase
MLLMMAEALRLCDVSRALPDSAFWSLLCQHQSHVEWAGCSLHDLIQPSFSFVVGVALPFSIASRLARGQAVAGMAAHAFWRAFLLTALGVFLRSIGRKQTYFTFEDTLTQIGLGYGFLFLLGFRSARWQWATFAVLMFGYWLTFAFYPAPGPDFDYAKVGVSEDWLKAHGLAGFAAHWQKNSNLAWAFDTWFLNLFPREKAFAFNGGGYATLSFIPTLGTMLLGLVAGGVLRGTKPPWQKVEWFAAVGALGLVLGVALDRTGVCPLVKRIWTPSWTIFSGGWCFLFLAAFYAVIDIWQRRGWAFALVVIGMNSIAAYCMDHLFGGFIRAALRRHLSEGYFRFLGAPYEPLLLGASELLVLWLLLFWMHRRKLFLRI